MNEQNEQNGNAIAKLPTIELYWDEKTQQVSLHFKADEFRTWDFIIMCLEQGKRVAEDNRRMAQMAAMQQQAAQAIQGQQLARQIGPRLRH